MKKILAVTLSLLLIFVLTACNKDAKNTDSNISGLSQITSSTTTSTKANKNTNKNTNKDKVVSEKNSSDDESQDVSSDPVQLSDTNNNKNELTQDESSQDGTETSSIGSVTNNSTNQKPQSSSSQKSTENLPKDNETNNSTSSNTKDNDDLENAPNKNMDVPENMKLLSTDEASEENNTETITVSAVAYELDGSVVNWTTENDFIYVYHDFWFTICDWNGDTLYIQGDAISE